MRSVRELTDVGEEGGLILGECVLESIEYVNLDGVVAGSGEGGRAVGEVVGHGAIDRFELILGEVVEMGRKVVGAFGGVVGGEGEREGLEMVRVESRHRHEEDRGELAVLRRIGVGVAQIRSRGAERTRQRQRESNQR